MKSLTALNVIFWCGLETLCFYYTIENKRIKNILRLFWGFKSGTLFEKAFGVLMNIHFDNTLLSAHYVMSCCENEAGYSHQKSFW